MVREKVLNTGTFLRRFCDLTFDGFSEKGILCRWQISLSMTHWCPIRKTAQLRVAAAVPCPAVDPHLMASSCTRLTAKSQA
eukprot:9496070-Pyramimonas_sp.AAC.2